MPPDYIELEKQRIRLVKQTLSTSSITLQVISYYNYFSKIIPFDDRILEEAFLTEFIEDFTSKLSTFEVWGIEPGFTKKLVDVVNQLKDRPVAVSSGHLLTVEAEKLGTQLSALIDILEGREQGTKGSRNTYFPLIDEGNTNGFYGILETITIRINRAAGADKFIIIPSEREIEKGIMEQTKISWELALQKLKEYVKKPFTHHEVLISFEKKDGFYQGASLGTALNVSFLSQLMEFYNPPYSLSIVPDTAFTGALSITGEALPAGDKIIRQKTAAVFYSFINTFIVPRQDEQSALEMYKVLKEKFPSRKLKILPIETIDDVLNRRDIIEIKKRHAAARAGKFMRKNWISTATIIVSLTVILFLFILDLDDNPASLSSDGSNLYIKNKNDKVLWTKYLSFDLKQMIPGRSLSRFAKIVDINSDGENEVVITGQSTRDDWNYDSRLILRCYDKDENELWNSSFLDSVYSRREILNTEYNLSIIDTLTYAGKKSLFLCSANGPSFSSAVYRIDLSNGKRLPGTLWASGHIMNCYLGRNTDNRPEIIGAGYDNGYEDLVFFVYTFDTLTSVRPTTDDYLIKGFPAASMKAYIRFPKNDFDNYMKVRTPGYLIDGLAVENNKIIFGSAIPPQHLEAETGYAIDFNYNDIDINFSSSFRVQRDTLVAHGLLKPPYTDTKEYREIIKNSILYWKNGGWVKRSELK